MTKWKGRVASLSPHVADLRGGVSLAALVGALAVAGGLVLAPGLAVAGSCSGTGGTYTCSGAADSTSDVTQTLSSSSALTVTTSAGFGIQTTTGRAFDLSGQGGLTFTDNNTSGISAAGFGIFAANSTSGALSVTTTGTIATTSAGIFAVNYAGTNLTINAASLSTTSYGIYARNYGTGTTSVTTTGTVTSSSGQGVQVKGAGAGITINTAAVEGYVNGVFGANLGSGAMSITSTGLVVGNSQAGVYGRNGSAATSLSISAAAVTGSDNGITARNFGTADLTVTATGTVTGGTGSGVYALNNSSGTNLVIAAADASGQTYGIAAVNYGTGTLSVIATGDVTATTNRGILARSYGTDATIQAVKVTGLSYGIYASNSGSGALSITTTGLVTGTNQRGIQAHNFSGTDITISAADAYGANGGILANNQGSGTVSITVSGAVTAGATAAAISTLSTSGGAVTINLLSTASVSATSGVAVSDGDGDATVTVNGAIVNGEINLSNGADTLTIASRTDLSGVTSMSGGTDASIDTLNLNAAFSSGDLSDWEVINLNATPGAAFTVGSAITGTGELNVQGTGFITLSGINTLSGATTVSGGTLSVTGSLLNSAVTVASGATLSGTGTVGSLIAQSGSNIYADVLIPAGKHGVTTFGGVYTPSFGALTIDTDATLAAGSTLTIGVFGTGSAEHSQLVVGGSAILAGDLYVEVTNGNTGATALTSGGTISNVLVSGTGITGAFASVSDNSALFDFTAVTNGNAMDLSITGSSVTAVGAVATTGLSPAAGAAAVFDTLISDGTSGDMQTVVTALGSLATDAAVAKAVYQTLPLFTGAAAGASAPSTGAASSAIDDHLAEMDAGATSGLGLSKGVAWLSPLGGWAHQSELDGSAGYDAKLYGMIGGADAEVAPDLRAGLAFAYTQSRLADVSDIISNKMTVDSYQAIAYGTWNVAADVRLRADLSGGRNQFDGTRQIAFATLNRTAESSYAGYSFNAGSSLEKRFRLSDALTFTPAVSLRYGATWEDAYAETGANALNLQVEERYTQKLRSGLDGRFDYMLANGMEISANAGLAYDLLNNRSRLTVAYQGASGNSFQVEGPNGSPWTGHAGVGVLMKLDSGVDVSAAYTLGVGDGLSSHTAGLSAKWAF